VKHRLNPAFVTVAEAAVIVGVTPQAVHKRIRAGTIPSEAARNGQRILRRDGLERRWWGSSQRIADMPDHGRQAISSTQPDWQAIADRLNSFIDPHAWTAPPWSADQVATLQTLLELATDE
jgi:hypothetical protein